MSSITTYKSSSITYDFKQFSASTKEVTSCPLNLTSSTGDLIEFFIVKNESTPKTGNKCVSVCLRFSEIKEHLTVHYQMSLIDASGNRRFTNGGSARHNFTSGTLYIDRNYLLDSASGLLSNDTLAVYCELQLVKGIDLPANNHQQQIATSKVLQDYNSLLENAKFSDVLFVVGKGRAKKEFHVHKNILSTRSPVFGAMFDHKDTKEAKENRVEITDVAVDVFEQFIRFVYMAKVMDLDKHAADLLIVADKYQMDCLKSLCSHYLSSKLTTESVASVLVLADLHSVSELKSKCIDHIVEHASEVMARKDWKLIKDKPDLLEQLFQSQSKKFKK